VDIALTVSGHNADAGEVWQDVRHHLRDARSFPQHHLRSPSLATEVEANIEGGGFTRLQASKALQRMVHHVIDQSDTRICARRAVVLLDGIITNGIITDGRLKGNYSPWMFAKRWGDGNAVVPKRQKR